MADTNNYIETDKEREEGYVDTGEIKFECENKDPRSGWHLGIDVAGQYLPKGGRLLPIALLLAKSFAPYLFQKKISRNNDLLILTLG